MVGIENVAGDTDAVNELSSVKCDVAMVPIGGTYTINDITRRQHPASVISTRCTSGRL